MIFTVLFYCFYLFYQVYQEYIYDDTNKLSVPQDKHRQSNNNNNNNNNNNDQTFIVQRHSVSAMPLPSVNKWAAPLAPRKSLTIDNNNAIPSTLPMSHGAGGGSGSSDNSSTNKKYDPCVGFFAGAPVISPDSKASRSNSVTSSGSITPNRTGKTSGKGTPKRTSNGSTYDPCVAWIGGKPISNIEESSKENCVEENLGVPPFKLQNALRKEQGKKPYSVGTKLAPKQIEGVSKKGAVSNIAGMFANGNWDELSVRKKSATSVLRDDFPMLKSRTKSECHNDENIPQQQPQQQSRQTNQQQQQGQGPMKFNLNITVDSKRKTSESEIETTRSPFDRGSSSYSSLPARYHQRKLSSNTSQATLVESRNKPQPKEGVTALALNTIILNGGVGGEGREKALSPVTYRKRNLLGRGGRKVSVSSSVENTDEEDSHNESDDENELNNWKGRRISYLAATAKQEKTSSGTETNVAVDTQEADDEDSDANVSPVSFN